MAMLDPKVCYLDHHYQPSNMAKSSLFARNSLGNTKQVVHIRHVTSILLSKVLLIMAMLDSRVCYFDPHSQRSNMAECFLFSKNSLGKTQHIGHLTSELLLLTMTMLDTNILFWSPLSTIKHGWMLYLYQKLFGKTQQVVHIRHLTSMLFSTFLLVPITIIGMSHTRGDYYYSVWYKMKALYSCS